MIGLPSRTSSPERRVLLRLFEGSRNPRNRSAVFTRNPPIDPGSSSPLSRPNPPYRTFLVRPDTRMGDLTFRPRLAQRLLRQPHLPPLSAVSGAFTKLFPTSPKGFTALMMLNESGRRPQTTDGSPLEYQARTAVFLDSMPFPEGPLVRSFPRGKKSPRYSQAFPL